MRTEAEIRARLEETIKRQVARGAGRSVSPALRAVYHAKLQARREEIEWVLGEETR